MHSCNLRTDPTTIHNYCKKHISQTTNLIWNENTQYIKDKYEPEPQNQPWVWTLECVGNGLRDMGVNPLKNDLEAPCMAYKVETP